MPTQGPFSIQGGYNKRGMTALFLWGFDISHKYSQLGKHNKPQTFNVIQLRRENDLKGV